MTNNTPDYKDNLYFEKKDCKNCPYTDEYCASGDCERDNDLTDKWKKGELPSGYYYVKNEFGNIFPSDYSEDYDYIGDTVIKDFFTEVSEIKEVLEQVPSYEEWKELIESEEKSHLQVDSYYNEILELKELLKEVKYYLPEFETPMDILAKIDEAIK